MTSRQPAAPAGVEKIAALEQALGSVIRGKDEAVRLAVVCLLARGHLLIEDVPGVGKTTLGHTLARSLNCAFHRVQFTSDMLPSDVLGVTVYNAHTEEFEFKPGPVFTNILLADEINRTTPKTQSALLEAMNEQQVTVEGRTYPLPQPFMVIATQNPLEHYGTYPLPESQLDRFLLRMQMGYPDAASEREILCSNGARPGPDQVRPVATAADISELQELAGQVRVDDSLTEYMLAVVEKTRSNQYLTLGVSPRGSLALRHAAQALALTEGRDYCLPDDFKRLVVPVFAHRVVVSSRYGSSPRKSEQAEQILQDILSSVDVPL
ncbi:MAG TPA: MoxR family ATPase [Bryobacterales bacterium]|nr:MoxR family ATPase [Bryobacterales bacterium]